MSRGPNHISALRHLVGLKEMELAEARLDVEAKTNKATELAASQLGAAKVAMTQPPSPCSPEGWAAGFAASFRAAFQRNFAVACDTAADCSGGWLCAANDATSLVGGKDRPHGVWATESRRRATLRGVSPKPSLRPSLVRSRR